MSDILDYDSLIEAYEKSLLTTLRGHRPAVEYLDLWVPDSDPVKGVLNMIEAAHAAGVASVSIRISRALLPPERQPDLTAAAGGLGAVTIVHADTYAVVSVSGMQSGGH